MYYMSWGPSSYFFLDACHIWIIGFILICLTLHKLFKVSATTTKGSAIPPLKCVPAAAKTMLSHSKTSCPSFMT